MSASEGHQGEGEAEAIDRAADAIAGDAAPEPGQVLTHAPHPLPDGVTHASPWRRLAAWALDALLFAVTLGIGWIVWAYTLAGGGQTPAKKLLGLRVILAEQTESAGLPRMFFLRWFVGALVVPIVVAITIGIILLMPFWDRRNQNLWDKISSCVVIHDPGDVWTGRTELSAAARGPQAGGRPFRS